MKTIATLIGTMIPATVCAAAQTPAGNDGIFVWIFLGFFALIVVGQLIPAVMLIMGLARGITAKTAAKAEAR
jgi:hypothetical protein